MAHIAGKPWVSVGSGRGNVVLISEYLTQGMDSLDLTGPGLTEPEQPFLGTVRLEALPYRNVDISKFYPYGDVSCPET